MAPVFAAETLAFGETSLHTAGAAVCRRLGVCAAVQSRNLQTARPWEDQLYLYIRRQCGSRDVQWGGSGPEFVHLRGLPVVFPDAAFFSELVAALAAVAHSECGLPATGGAACSGVA